VKRSGRDEPMWVAIHLCMEAMIEITLYGYPYLKLAKVLCLSYFLFNKIGEESRARFCLAAREGGGEGGDPSNLYTYE
jgi:hypothetical protein